MAVQRFEAELLKDDKTSGTSVKVPFDVLAVFGSRSQIKVKGTIDGHPFRGSIHPYGGTHYRGIKKELREAIGKTYGDSVGVIMDIDTEPRVVEVPEDLRKALEKDGSARSVFDRLSYSHKKEYVDWINGAKKVETRERRITKTIEMLTP